MQDWHYSMDVWSSQYLIEQLVMNIVRALCWPFVQQERFLGVGGQFCDPNRNT
jgi:hypothetical protein